jgi:oxygen-dependent protoporphyrinogen oxidase
MRTTVAIGGFSHEPALYARPVRPVAIIGAGITGLTAAFSLARRGVPVSVYEASGRVGGVIRSSRERGYLVEWGPNTLLPTPLVAGLLRNAGLEGRRVAAEPQARARYIVRDRRPVAVPAGPLGLLTTPLLSWRAKLAIAREPFLPPRRDGAEESLAQLVTRRFDAEVLDRAADALVAGIYAGDPAALSVTHAFPKLKALEDERGSIVKGTIVGTGARRASPFSFDEGLQVLPDALASHLGDAVALRTPVSQIARTAGGFLVRAPGLEAEHAAVVFCAGGPSLAVLRDASLEPAMRVRHAAVASVALGFRRQDVGHPCAGFGMLVPRAEGLRILGTIFSSSLFSGRAPEGHVLLTTYVGGVRSPELAALPAEQLYEIVASDLRTVLDVRGAPTFAHHAYYPRGIPQYDVGFGGLKERMADAETRAPGLTIAGQIRDGVSLGDGIASGLRAAERVEAFLR